MSIKVEGEHLIGSYQETALLEIESMRWEF